MTNLIRDIFSRKDKTFSIEVFPVSTPQARERLLLTLQDLARLEPDFISCTYGAGGGNREKTLEVVEHIQKTHGVSAMAHLTCVGNSRLDIETIFKEFERRGVRNILALRGDPPQDGSLPAGDFRYSSELVAFIRSKLRDRVSIGVAGFPEKHPLAPSAEADAAFLKEKISAGAEFVITQLFFENSHYFDYVARLRALGVQARIIPGILPITDYEALKRFCQRCGAVIPPQVHAIFGPLAQDPARTLEAGIDYAVRQCKELLKSGAPGIHFYALNKIHPLKEIWNQLDKR